MDRDIYVHKGMLYIIKGCFINQQFPCQMQEKQEESELRSLPPPSLAHLAALSVAVTELAKEQGITDDDLKVRQEIVEEMSKVITTFLPGTTSFYTQF